jgi:sugar phosphate isomerase/epimerase
MQISCDPILFFDDMVQKRTMSMEDWFKLAETLDLAGTEVQYNCLDSYDLKYLKNIRNQLHKHHLKVSQFIASPDFTTPDSEKRAGQVAKTIRDVDIAAFFEAPCLRITAGQEYPQVSYEQSLKWVTDSFREILEYSESKGVWLAFENHYKDFFWEHPDFSRNGKVFLEIIDCLKDTSLKVNFDCSNPIVVGQDPVDILKSVANRIVHVHCNDRVAFYRYDHAVVGEGLVNIPQIFSILRTHGYNGWLSIEYNGNQGLEGLKRSIAYVRQEWESVEASGSILGEHAR